jgi:perosamine synthetase
MKIPLSAPDITEPEIEAVAAVLRGSQLSIGPKQVEFERAVAARCGTRHAVAVSSGTAGLHLALLAHDIGAGDEVIVPSFAFIAAANVIRHVGALPVFVEIDAGTLNVDPEAVERAVTPRTRAIMAVHTFGRPAAMSRLREIANLHQLILVEDACEALGAEIGGRAVGSFGEVAVFAFYPNKQITTGEGGIVVTDDDTLADRIRSLRNQGRTATDDWYEHSSLGFNYRLSELACALGVTQMARLSSILERREEIARKYEELLAEVPGLKLPETEVPGCRISWFVYVVRLEPPLDVHRDAIVRSMQREGIGVGRYFAPIHRQPAYAAFHSIKLPVTEAEACRTMALPFFNRITLVQQTAVANALRTAMAEAGAKTTAETMEMSLPDEAGRNTP